MNSLHLTKGSECPPREKGKIRIYSMRLCPYAQRALLVATAKGVEFEVVNCHLKEKPEWMKELNPFEKVPILEMDRGILYESLIICSFLEDEFESGRKLISNSPFQKAIDKIWIERFNQAISLYYKIIYSCETTTKSEITEYFERFNKSLQVFETELLSRGTFFFNGGYPGMTDYAFWPWMERFPILVMLYPEFNQVYTEFERKRPTLNGWVERMKEDPAVKEIYIPPEIHFKYAQTSRSGKPNYDILHEENAKL